MFKTLLSVGFVFLLLSPLGFSLTLSGSVCGPDGQPLPADVSLRRFSYLPSWAVLVAEGKQSAAYSLTVSAPGLYLLVAEAAGCRRLEIPVILDAEGGKPLGLFLGKNGATENPPKVCSDDRLARWAAIHQVQRERHERYERERTRQEKGPQAGSAPAPAGWPIDWQNDLRALAEALAAENDPSTQAFLAACCLDLGDLGATLDDALTTKIRALLPGESPFWSVNLQASFALANSLELPEAKAFFKRMEERNPDPEARAIAILYAIIEAAGEYDLEAWRKQFDSLASQYPQSRLTGFARKSYDPAGMPGIGQPFPPFQALGLDRRTVTLDLFKGKVLLVDLWAVWCAPCVKELPGMQALYDRYKKDGFEILSLSIDGNMEKIAEFRQKHDMPWAQAVLPQGRDNPLCQTLKVNAIPRAFLVDRDGRILEIRRSLLRGDHLREVVERVMKTCPPNGGK